MVVRQYFKDLVHLLFPSICVGCETPLLSHEELLCTECLYHLPFTDFHLDPESATARQLWGKLDFQFAVSMLYLSKFSRVEKIIHNLKYGNQPAVGYYLGKMYARKLVGVSDIEQIDLILPVPLHRSKLRTRGYNQSSYFAKGLAEGLEKEWTDTLLRRLKATVSQTKKSRSDRYDNVENIFHIKDSGAIKDKHILIVDDVLTTGATISSLGNVLIDAGAKVSVATIARA
ncbi:ComF family protein [Sphingobacterium alkalisoli]|uniref:ComF family protein n=1 Tax=Sphingobacterium alkalisoli TaxID=1874115 RepID=A0A4U0H7T3_9SPHI|nr:ComF family protein [Sphingobacterium alkalisoli]TJY67746.1 ComF family protein [Sphingobacterium alkalisoli]GGH11623.1 amidophosphoribosyltransferase [Sphingobacterium alkalisoli]